MGKTIELKFTTYLNLSIQLKCNSYKKANKEPFDDWVILSLFNWILNLSEISSCFIFNFILRKDSLNFQQDKRENSALFGLRFAHSLVLWITLDVNNGQI